MKLYNKETLKKFVGEFRIWQNQWDLFDNKQLKNKPKSIDVFIEDLLKNKVLN